MAKQLKPKRAPGAPKADDVPVEQMTEASEVMTEEAAPVEDTAPLLAWSAPEFTQEQRPALWYLGLFGAAALLIAVSLFGVYLFSNPSIFDVVMTVLVIVVAAAALGVIARRKPEMAQFGITDKGVQINERFFPFRNFQSAAFIRDALLPTIELEPTKRFAPHVGLTLDNQSTQEAVKLLSSHLPFRERDMDTIDRLSRYLKF